MQHQITAGGCALLVFTHTKSTFNTSLLAQVHGSRRSARARSHRWVTLCASGVTRPACSSHPARSGGEASMPAHACTLVLVRACE